MHEQFKEEITKELNQLKKKLSELEENINSIEQPDQEVLEEVLKVIKTMNIKKQNDNPWRSVGLFLLGGMTFLILIVIIAVLST